MSFGKFLNFGDPTNEELMSIKSPRRNVGGPYAVLYKNEPERWAVVVVTWDSEPSLGIRWFKGNIGTPSSRSNPTWFIIPPILNLAVLNTLGLSSKTINIVEAFLSGKYKKEEYKSVFAVVKPIYVRHEAD